MSQGSNWMDDDPLRAQLKTTEPNKGWHKESLYNTRVLLNNWFEERRHFEVPCSRCTGYSITRTDYLAPSGSSSKCIPPKEYDEKAKNEGEGWMLLRNYEDHCCYLENYTTTYDLMHNWEVRRHGVKPKPWRDWKLIYDRKWVPELDNTVPFGNLTQLSYRRAPQLPLVPNDWDVYANNKTTYQTQFDRPRFPDSYTLCHYAPTKAIKKEVEDMVTITNPTKRKDPLGKCNSGETEDNTSACVGKYQKNRPRFNDNITSGLMNRTVEPQQSLLPRRFRSS